MDKRTEKRKALEALNKVLKTESDIDNAFFCDLGPVCLKYGDKVNWLLTGWKEIKNG